MLITLCKSKIHKARVTACELDYEGSLLIDVELLAESGIFPYEKILVSNSANGERFETYAIPGRAGEKQIMLNGPAAKMGNPGDVLTIMAFGQLEEKDALGFKPKIIILNEKNELIQKKGFGTKVAFNERVKMEKQSGQTTVEYSVMLVLCVTIAIVMVVLLSALNDYGWRLLSLVGLDYP